MTIPPFPSQDLAKLVLGYLAEEQLMTAYDEFLQASPYIDALRNEYDRIFMTSLKNILAEYRAVKIFVETCKPLPLRRRLVQCTNLVDQVKFLVNNADISKIQAQDTSSDKISYVKQNTSTASKQSNCEACSLSVTSCLCKSKQKSSVHTLNNDTTSNSEKSVEATALEDLPGNHSTRKKHAKVLEKEALLESNIGVNESTKLSSNVQSNSNTGLNTLNSNSHSSQIRSNESSCLSAIVKISDTPECREKIEEFNSILNKVCSKKSKEDNQKFCVPSSELIHKSVSNASTFQEFASGVGGRDTRNVPVPDSSTSENSVAQTVLPTEISRNTCGHVNDLTNRTLDNSATRPYSTHPYPRIKPKTSNEQKIKIISDIKVDRPFTTLNNATSTPLMQTIVVNGTPAYKQKLPVANNYTKDEIMAMPTIIVVPASGPPPNMTQTKPVLAQKLHQAKTKTVSSAQILSPLVLDVSSSNGTTNIRVETKQPELETQNPSMDVGLVKTVDLAKNASVPKDNIITCSQQINTPQVLPPVRKSSSTPRRNSHIRVLDFTTPRRILHETINEIVPNEICDNHVEIDNNKNTNLVISSIDNSENNIVDMRTVKVHKIETCRISKVTSETDKLLKFNKKANWDADLRALTVMNNDTSNLKVINNSKPTKSASKIKKPNRKSVEPPVEKEEEADKSQGKKSRSKRKISPKVKKSKKLKKLQEEEAQYANCSKAVESKSTVRPVFNIMGSDNYAQKEDKKEQSKEENNQNKSNNEDVNETPEAERLCFQNEIGARLNISEFLETPYKQVLYDIQMETPKFLGPDLPNDPISDIKIMSIPTPRFFDTPKPPHATPSSYSSRPTDYSSGGSYYKPDDQDYLRIPEIECPVTSSKDEPHAEVPEESDSSYKRSSRPVRKCTKNVSYVDRNNADSNKTKEKVIEVKPNIVPNLSDSTSPNSSFENNKDLKLKTPKASKSKSHIKSDSKKKLDSVKKRKTPVKKDKVNSFMKIKPRRPTPTKDKKRTRRKTDVYTQSNTSKLKEKQPVSVKEKNIHVTPVVVPAPKKSRRKSSTPRKIHCTKPFTSESSTESPENNASASATAVYKVSVKAEQNTASSNDSDTEQMALQWSDDGSQDTKVNDCESEDITKIKQYIETSSNSKSDFSDKAEPLHIDLIKRGFDVETAKIIERDLLDASPSVEPNRNACDKITETKNAVNSVENLAETDTSVTNELQIVQDDETEDDIELSAYECHEGSNNYVVCTSEAKEVSKKAPSKLKDKFCMEVCIDDGVAIRLRATSFNMLYDNTPANEEELGYSFRETEVAVSSISNIEKLYTPLKDHKAECYEIFDSTLTSLDTPLKLNSPKHMDQKVTEIEIVFEEEKVDIDKTDTKKRKRLQSSMNDSDEALNESKKTKPEPQYLFNSTNIQNIDIESVLKKLHGP
ncbi:unnamed protein product [Chrysodeixis includens]|uniref:Uncharacterized protein n=1 Tax=Chrysodeixis includens TaxID=689277 RepID=A0A9P0C274_CHRIL|nr:unnamed protein product [Chrysodeixis includens]